MPFSARCLQFYIAIMVAATVAVVSTLPLAHPGIVSVLALGALLVVAERISRMKVGISGLTMSVSLVVTILTVLVLPPPAAALLGLIGSFCTPRQPTWTWTKQILNSAISSLVPASGAAVCYLTGGHLPDRFLSYPAFLWPFAAAVSTCLFVNNITVAVFVTLSSANGFGDVLRNALKRVSLPYYSSAVLALTFLSLWHEIGWYTAPLVVVPMYIAHWSLSQYEKEEAAHEGTIAALVQAVEIKDSYTRGHSERVARGAEMLAQQLKMPAARLAMLRFAGLLHDIGKLGVPTRLLTSTGGLTEEEFKLLCLHPNHGVAVLRDIRFLTEVYEGVLYHHERLDGRGYPTGKSGDQIPQFARIIGVADAFDAMTSTRSYRAARSVEEAVAELRRGAGTQFDPVLVEAFEQALKVAERSGQPWVPTELAPVEPQAEDEAAAAATGPWPLPKRVPGFSFADHDDPFVPVEWFSAWYPSWLAPDGADAAGGAAAGLGAIPGQRAGEPVAEPEPRDPDGGESDPRDADLDDGWSERMHSAVVRESGPEPDEGWDWDGERVAGGEASGKRGEASRKREETETAAADSADPAAVSEPQADGSLVPEDGSATGAGFEEEAGSEAEIGAETAIGTDAGSGAEGRPDTAAGPSSRPASADSGRWPVDPGLRGDPRGSMRVRAATPAADPDPRGPGAEAGAAQPAAARQKSSVSGLKPADDADDTVPGPAPSAMPLPKLGDPEAWTPSPEPWAASEPPAEAPKVADPAELPADGPEGRATPATGPSWFARGTPAPSATRHFFAAGDPGPWPPHDSETEDSGAEDTADAAETADTEDSEAEESPA